MGRVCVRRTGHRCRVHRLWFCRRQAGALAPRNCKRIAGTKGVSRRTRDSAARTPLSFRHRLWCGYGLFCGEPHDSCLDRARSRFWCSVWRGRLFLHEPHRGAALRCRQAAVFHEPGDHRRDHSHLLRRTSHFAHRAPILQVIVRTSYFERGLAPGLLSYGA